jgi:uncharacterized protein
VQERKVVQIEAVGQLPANMCLLLIKFYQLFISPFMPQVCRFYPTCSQYFYQAILRYGLLKGGVIGIKRILKCHPFNPGGYDPVK